MDGDQSEQNPCTSEQEILSAEAADQVPPMANEVLYKEVMKAKKEEPSRFQSYWEEDEENVDTPPSQQQLEENSSLYCLWAAENGKEDVLAKLLQRDRNLMNAKDQDGYTPLHRAAYMNQTGCVTQLLQSGASVNARTNDGWTPLHSACRWNAVDAVSLLLQNGASIAACTNGGLTPLHLAASEPEARDLLVLLLMSRYSQPDLQTNSGDTAKDICERSSSLYYMFEITDESLCWRQKIS